MGDKAFKTHPVGTGPFRFSNYSAREYVRLAANDAYFRGSPRLGSVEVWYLPEAVVREKQFREGHLYVMRGFAEIRWLERAAADKSSVVDTFGVSEVANIHFNTQVRPFDDPRVRKAVAHALNRDEFLDPFGRNAAIAAMSPMPPEFFPGGLTEAAVRHRGKVRWLCPRCSVIVC